MRDLERLISWREFVFRNCWYWLLYLSKINWRKKITLYGVNVEIKGQDSTFRTALVTHGSVTDDGTCTAGAPLHANGRLYTAPVRTSEIKIRFGIGEATVDVEENQVILGPGIRCPYDKTYCFRSDYGNAFWTNIMSSFKVCSANKKEQYTVLFQGPANKVIEYRDGDELITYSLKLNNYDFQFVITKKPLYICGQKAYQTEHPKLSIIDKTDTVLFVLENKPVYEKDINLMTYF